MRVFLIVLMFNVYNNYFSVTINIINVSETAQSGWAFVANRGHQLDGPEIH